MTKIFLILIFSFVMLMAQSQNEYVAHWETVFYNETDFRYVTNNDPNVDPNWRANGFDDSNWQVGAGGFGYGDNDDGTIVEGATSVFYRKEFNVVDKSEISAMILHIDYDDAFVAYLNGVEIARSAGLLDEYPDQSAISLVEHEALIPLGGTPNSYNVYNNLLSSILAKDTNVLAIQVHNVSSTSSDLSLSTWLSVGLRTDVERYLETPEWFRPPDVQTTLTSNLPIVVITTPDGQPITDEPKITAEMGIVNNGIGQLNNSTDAFNEYNGYIGIEFRGNSTQQFPKKPYGLETRDANGANLNVALLGMPEENDWILRASYIDHTFIRNSLANYMSRITGHWASRTRHVELILNGEYQGIYLLMEKIKRDKNRVAIAKLESHEMSGEDLTGGYIWEVSGFGENFGLYRSIVYPKITDIVPLQLSYIRDFDDQFRAKMASFTGEYKDPNTGYVKHINVQSFVDELLVQEAMRNSDAYGWSSYFNKDKNELIQAGPVWDFDQSSGNSSYPDNGIVEGWMATHPGTSLTPFFWPLLFNDLFFKYTLANRWKKLRSNEFSDSNLIAYIDSIADALAGPQVREFEKWPVLGVDIYRETTGFKDRDTYQKEVDYLKSFLVSRWKWMDEELSTIARPSEYPDIVLNPVEEKEVSIYQSAVYLDMNKVFGYRYTSKLKFEALSENENVVKVEVKKSDSLKIEIEGLGSATVFLYAKDTYGNEASTSFNLHVLDVEVRELLTVKRYIPIQIHPNPANSGFMVSFKNANSSIFTLELFNMSGELLNSVTHEPGNVGSFYYSVNQLSEGVYPVVVTLGTGEQFQSRVVVKK